LCSFTIRGAIIITGTPLKVNAQKVFVYLNTTGEATAKVKGQKDRVLLKKTYLIWLLAVVDHGWNNIFEKADIAKMNLRQYEFSCLF
jgi:hypothetical protein